MSVTYDYAWLTKQIANFLNKADLYETIPTYIGLAEASLTRQLTQAGINGATTRATATITAEFEKAPADFGMPIAMTIYDPISLRWCPMELDTESGIAIIKGNRESEFTPAIPHRYCVVNDCFQFSPTPDQPYNIDLAYFAKLVPLDTTNTSNWAITNHPDVYLYGALIHAAPMIGAVGSRDEPGALPVWQGMYQQALGEVIASERRKRGSMFTPAYRASDTPPNYGRRRWAFNVQTGV